jgi:hypothetical protein
MGGSVIYWFTGASCQAVADQRLQRHWFTSKHEPLATTASERHKGSSHLHRHAQRDVEYFFHRELFCFALALPFSIRISLLAT